MIQRIDCYCGSKKKYRYCCEPYLSDKKIPQTAEQLMRSRYTAFCRKDIQYLIDTAISSEDRSTDEQELAKTMQKTTWLGLLVVSTEQGKKQDKVGFVEFVAAFEIDKPRQHHERSRFIKNNRRWFYIDGEILPDLILKGKVDCWCGSGKKYRNCHQNS